MLNTKCCILLTIFFVIIGTTSAQDLPIENGTVNTCEGLFLDDGVGGFYSANSYTYTICPDSPDDVIQVDFLAFSLWQSPNSNNSDRLYIYDGPNTGSTSLGSYTGSQLQGVSVTGTVNNPTGCLTFEFWVNPNTSGDFPGWEADISCTTPCATPTAASVILDPEPSGTQQSVGACVGDAITFSDNGSFAEPGYNLESYIWSFGNGSVDSTSGPIITRSFDEPGEYVVTLTVIDDNGCSSLNLEPLQVLVSTIPTFNTEFDNEICLGQTAIMDGSNIESQTWTSLPPQVVSGTTFLADGAGFTFESELTFDFFEPGATLESCDDLLGVYVNMEHSYLGDLSMQITCPDGTVVPILDQPNAGGGTYLGEPVDDNFDLAGENVPGIGYTYTWDPFATNGNLDDQPANTVDFVNETGQNDSNDIVPEGTYQTEGNLCDLVGCPLNGTWTFQITDNIGADNGHIFYWGLDFNPEYFPDVTTFTPTIGMDADSSYWTGPNLEALSDDGNTMEFTPDGVGDYEFTFHTTNNFGCVQDTTITITVVPGPEADAGEDLLICTDSLQLDGSVAGIPPPPANCDYTLEMLDVYGDGWNGFSVTVIEDGTTVGTYTINDGYENTTSIPLNHGSTIQINTNTGTWDSEVSYFLYNSEGDLVFSDGEGFDNPAIGNNIWNGTVDCQPGTPDYVFEWSPAEGLSDHNVQNPMVLVEESTTYTMSVWVAGTPECATSDEVTVNFIPNLNPGEDNTIQICYFEEPIDLNGNLGGNPTPDGIWTDANGSVVDPEIFDPADIPNGGSAVFTYTVGLDNCEFSSELTIEVQTSAENADCCITNAVAGEGYEICDVTAMLSAEDPLGSGTWSSNSPDVVFEDANDPNTMVTVPEGGLYTFTFTDNNGINCSDSDEMTIHFSPEIIIDLINIEDPSCASACNGSVEFEVSGGIAPLSYSWSGGLADASNPSAADSFCGGEYLLTVTDAIGCSDTTTFGFDDPPPPPIQAIATSPNCFGECNGSISIVATNAVLFTFNGGASYTVDSSLDSLCAGTYHVGLIDVYGCENTTIVEVVDPSPVVADFDFSPNPATILFPVVQFNNQSSPSSIQTFSWTFGTDNLMITSDEINPIIEFPSDSADRYSVMLIATDANGCIDTTFQQVHVEEEFLFYIPNSFTPNEDGKNDVWKPKGNNVHPHTYHLWISDRYGNLVFETSDLEQGWNGDINGGNHYAQNEVYVYQIEASSATTLEKKKFKGHITVIR